MEIIPNVYQITHRATNVFLISEEELTLIDTGIRGSYSPIANLIHRLGRSIEELSLIIITHNHVDHIGGLAELRKRTPARVAVHQADISDYESQLPYPGRISKLLRFPLFSVLRPLFYAKPSDIDIKLKGDETLAPLGGLKVIHTPGHTPGSICLFSPQKKLIFVGDALNRWQNKLHFPPKPVSTDLTQAIDSVKQMSRLDFDILCFGHGKPLIENSRDMVYDLIKKHQS